MVIPTPTSSSEPSSPYRFLQQLGCSLGRAYLSRQDVIELPPFARQPDGRLARGISTPINAADGVFEQLDESSAGVTREETSSVQSGPDSQQRLYAFLGIGVLRVYSGAIASHASAGRSLRRRLCGSRKATEQGRPLSGDAL